MSKKITTILFPNYFKKIGVGLILLSFIVLVILGYYKLLPNFPEMKQQMEKFLFVLGLLFICFSREKNEDELVDRIRMQTLKVTFYYSVLFYLIDLLLPNSFSLDIIHSSFQFITFQLCTYFLVFFWNIRGGQSNVG